MVLAEVQTVHQDGSAGLHTRSLKYGKLRNGVFLKVSGAGGGSSNTATGGATTAGVGGGGVVRSRRQMWTVQTGNGGGEVNVVLGVNGYIWIAKNTTPSQQTSQQVSFARVEEMVSNSIYSSQNDDISPETRREISRLAGCVRALVEGGVRVDEDMVMRAYEASLEVDMEEGMDRDGGGRTGDVDEGRDFLGGERGKRVVAMALEAWRASVQEAEDRMAIE